MTTKRRWSVVGKATKSDDDARTGTDPKAATPGTVLRPVIVGGVVLAVVSEVLSKVL